MSHSSEHCSEEDLLLEYYGEPSAAATHLTECATCSARYRELQALLDRVTLDPPERGDRYGLEVWQAIRHRLPPRERTWFGMLTPQWGLAAAALLLLTVGFAAGRIWVPAVRQEQPALQITDVVPAVNDDEARRRVALMTMSDHFERSDRVLAEIMNADGPRDLSAEQRWASDLVAASRLYRHNVIAMNEPSVAAVLEEVERVRLDIVHQPAHATAADLDEIRRRIDSAALLFKVRVMSNELQYRLEQPPPVRPTTSASNIG
jgi:hypothetical protein